VVNAGGELDGSKIHVSNLILPILRAPDGGVNAVQSNPAAIPQAKGVSQ
jgi:hypothetical protein